MKIGIFIVALLMFQGCINKCGVSSRFYSKCKEYYDSNGVYHKECKNDIYDGCNNTPNDYKIGGSESMIGNLKNDNQNK